VSIFRKKMLAIGNENAGGCAGADLSDVDLTAARIDRRVKFQCASHRAYHAADGTIQFAEPDVWPLEYVNGVPVGRHEPEPQATNYRLGSRAPGATLYRLKKTGTDVISPAGVPEAIEYVTAQTSTPVIAALLYDLTLPESGPVTVSAIGRNGTAELTVRKNGDSVAVGFTDSEFSRAVLLSDYDATATRNRYAVYFPRDNGATGYIWHMQIETGDIATSPIMTTTSAVTRAAAFATVTNPGGQATAIRVHYSDGTTDEYDFGANGSDIQLPQSATNWGTRYITRIQYARGF
jgi:hypothetical protein